MDDLVVLRLDISLPSLVVTLLLKHVVVGISLFDVVVRFGILLPNTLVIRTRVDHRSVGYSTSSPFARTSRRVSTASRSSY